MKIINRAAFIAAPWALAALAVPAPAFAEGEGGASILIPKMAEFVPALIAFLIIWIVLAKIAWPKVLGMMDERSRRIQESLDEAERTKKKAIEDRAASDELMTDARRQAADIVLAARQDAEAERGRVVAAHHRQGACHGRGRAPRALCRGCCVHRRSFGVGRL